MLLRRLVLVILSVLVLGLVAAHAQDADTLKLDGNTYRLDGIDAPEIDQSCLNEDGDLYQCGLKAAEELSKFIAGRPIKCDGYAEDDIERTMGEFMGGFGKSNEAGQAQWKRTRDAVLRRRSEADAFAKAQDVEAEAVKLLPGLRASKYTKAWVEQKYEKRDASSARTR